MTPSNSKIIDPEGSEKYDYHKSVTAAMSDERTSIRYTRDLNKYDRIKSKNAVLVAGFSGPGLVGSIGANYTIEKLGMHQIACIDSEFIVPGCHLYRWKVETSVSPLYERASRYLCS
jgi:hypothetical protein